MLLFVTGTLGWRIGFESGVVIGMIHVNWLLVEGIYTSWSMLEALNLLVRGTNMYVNWLQTMDMLKHSDGFEAKTLLAHGIERNVSLRFASALEKTLIFDIINVLTS